MIDDRRTALEEAFESAEADARGEEYTPPVREEASPDTEVAEHVEEADTRAEPDVAAKQEQKAANAKGTKVGDRPRTKGIPPDERTGKPATAEAETATGEPAQPTSNLDKAPASWGVTRDALWAKTPADVRAVIAKREGEIQRGMSDAGRVKAIATEYADLIKPFHGTISQLGTNPKEAIHDVMVTATMMFQGTPEVKADIITEMIMRYGVDPAMLDQKLMAALQTGAKPGDWLKQRGANLNRPQPAPLDPRLQRMAERYEAAERAEEERLVAEASATVAKLEAYPHFEDVRQEMADLMEVAAKRGIVLSADEAYKRAVQLNPEVAKVVGSKKVVSDVSKAASTLARARRASSTVSGSPSPSSLNSQPSDRRAALLDAWDNAS